MKKGFAICMAAVVLSVACGTDLAGTAERPFQARHEADDIPVVIDVLILRPVGLAACVVGLAAAVIALPFAIPSKSTDKVYRALIAEPFLYTFKRPLGKSGPLH